MPAERSNTVLQAYAQELGFSSVARVRNTRIHRSRLCRFSKSWDSDLSDLDASELLLF